MSAVPGPGMRTLLLDGGDAAVTAMRHQPRPVCSAPPAIPGNYHMNRLETTTPHTKGAGRCKSEQVGRRFNSKINASSAHIQDQHVVLATIPKGPRNAIVLTEKRRGRESFADLRQFEPNGLRVLVPTMKGIGNIDVGLAQQLIVRLQDFVARCKR